MHSSTFTRRHIRMSWKRYAMLLKAAATSSDYRAAGRPDHGGSNTYSMVADLSNGCFGS